MPLSYLPDGENCVLIASNGGSDRSPAWLLNLKARPEARIRVGRRSCAVVACEARGAERERLWPEVTRLNPVYTKYEKMTKREIPLVILRPAVPDPTSSAPGTRDSRARRGRFERRG